MKNVVIAFSSHNRYFVTQASCFVDEALHRFNNKTFEVNESSNEALLLEKSVIFKFFNVERDDWSFSHYRSRLWDWENAKVILMVILIFV